jgi:hypothetical protein
MHSNQSSWAQDGITTKGPAALNTKFKVFGRLTVIFIEVKLEGGTGDECLDAIVQLIAEADGMYPLLTPVALS